MFAAIRRASFARKTIAIEIRQRKLAVRVYAFVVESLGHSSGSMYLAAAVLKRRHGRGDKSRRCCYRRFCCDSERQPKESSQCGPGRGGWGLRGTGATDATGYATWSQLVEPTTLPNIPALARSGLTQYPRKLRDVQREPARFFFGEQFCRRFEVGATTAMGT